MALVEKISLFFKQGSSDKYYNIAIEEVNGGFIVPFTYSRRGTSGQSGLKTGEPVPYDKAKKTYDKVVKQKKAKGYKQGTGNAPGTIPVITMHSGISTEKFDSGIFPQLLCPIEDNEVELFLKDPRYGAQEKKDGRRKFMQRKNETNISINRKGQEVGYPAIFDRDMDKLCYVTMFKSFLLDGEEVGEVFHVFDILERDSNNFKDYPYQHRYDAIEGHLALLKSYLNNDVSFKIVPLAVTEKEKRELYKKLKKEGKEGIVFKLLDAHYTEGRPSEDIVSYSQMCPQVKNKFYATATCVVIKVNEKRSVQLGLYEESKLIKVGNCTIPPNKKIPDGYIEVRYLYAYEGGSLYQPIYLIPRDDVDAEDCKISQLKYKSKS